MVKIGKHERTLLGKGEGVYVHDSDGNRVATPFPVQDSSNFSKLVQADCLVVRAPHAPPAKAGAIVSYIALGGGVIGA